MFIFFQKSISLFFSLNFMVEESINVWTRYNFWPSYVWKLSCSVYLFVKSDWFSCYRALTRLCSMWNSNLVPYEQVSWRQSHSHSHGFLGIEMRDVKIKWWAILAFFLYKKIMISNDVRSIMNVVITCTSGKLDRCRKESIFWKEFSTKWYYQE